MDDLLAFLNARLDEDDAAAKAWLPLGNPTAAQREHIARHDPGRVFREVEAKRAIVAEHAPMYPTTYPNPSGQPTCGVCHAGGFDWEPERWPCATIRALAAVDSDHPDYRSEWAP